MSKRTTKSRQSDEWLESDLAEASSATFDPDSDLPGWVFMAPNKVWGFEGVTSSDHPGACAHFNSDTAVTTVVKGTDAENVRKWRRPQFHVTPTEGNGLRKETAFDLVPRYVRERQLCIFYPDRHLGWLDDDTLRALRHELARLHPAD